MDRPDTMIEVHREVVEQQASGIYAGDHYDQDVDGTGFTAQASVTLELDHVWFIFETVKSLSSGNVNLRPWQEEIGGAAQDPLRHFALGLNVGTGSVITIESVACIPLVPLPPKTVTIPNGPRAGESQQIPFNEIPLYGRLTIHDHLEVRTVEPGKQTISLNLNPQDAPLLVAAPPADVLDSRLFGPDAQRRADGSTVFGGQDPKITWDIDYAEAHWITHSTVGLITVLLVWLGHVTVTGAELAISGASWSFEAELMDPERRGEYQGVQEVSRALGFQWAPWLYTSLVLSWMGGAGWLVIASQPHASQTISVSRPIQPFTCRSSRTTSAGPSSRSRSRPMDARAQPRAPLLNCARPCATPIPTSQSRGCAPLKRFSRARWPSGDSIPGSSASLPQRRCYWRRSARMG